jgi:hypothetical protein
MIDNDIAVSFVFHSAILCFRARFDFQGLAHFFQMFVVLELACLS